VNGDEFFAEAEREYVAGRVDKPLWARAVALSGGDEAAAMPAYLRARATAIRVAKRAKRREKSLRRGHAAHGATDASSVVSAHAETAPAQTPSPRKGIAGLERKYLAWAAGVAGIGLVGALAFLQLGGDATQQQSAAIPVARANASSTLSAGVPAGPQIADAQNRADVPKEDFPRKVQVLKEAGNWNVLVLYAVEWTRKQPANSEAWRTLSQGYFKLHQLGEALDTATKAVELASGDFLNWQNLGQVNLALQRTAEAHAAFQQAATLNDRDVVSLVQAGLLDAQLGRVADARTAFDKALAVNPKDVDALCGATSVAQKEGRLKDAEAITLQLKSIDGQCRGANTVESVRVVISSTPKSRAVLSTGR
jgi:Flp pilus assembly protein TadD